ncbi:unnamed protein product [Lupinus luteus]|uniref:Uncharacterized protein n=1 Tax=Lupinus luteus TaxID=3873 RepID=A0AAV1WP04_LUPLU
MYILFIEIPSSDFGVEEDRVNHLPSFQKFVNKKRVIGRKIEASGIPYTFVSVSYLGAYFINNLLHPYEKVYNITVYGNGKLKVHGDYTEDIGTKVDRSADEPIARTPAEIVGA